MAGEALPVNSTIGLPALLHLINRESYACTWYVRRYRTKFNDMIRVISTLSSPYEPVDYRQEFPGYEDAQVV